MMFVETLIHTIFGGETIFVDIRLGVAVELWNVVSITVSQKGRKPTSH
jgi:hypothetical protein